MLFDREVKHFLSVKINSPENPCELLASFRDLWQHNANAIQQYSIFLSVFPPCPTEERTETTKIQGLIGVTPNHLELL